MDLEDTGVEWEDLQTPGVDSFTTIGAEADLVTTALDSTEEECKLWKNDATSFCSGNVYIFLYNKCLKIVNILQN